MPRREARVLRHADAACCCRYGSHWGGTRVRSSRNGLPLAPRLSAVGRYGWKCIVMPASAGVRAPFLPLHL